MALLPCTTSGVERWDYYASAIKPRLFRVDSAHRAKMRNLSPDPLPTNRTVDGLLLLMKHGVSDVWPELFHDVEGRVQCKTIQDICSAGLKLTRAKREKLIAGECSKLVAFSASKLPEPSWADR